MIRTFSDRRRWLGALTAIAGIALVGGTPHAETIKLTAVTGHPPVFLWVKHVKDTLIPTIDRQLAKTGKYKIQWTQAYGGTLAKVGGELEAIEEGLADIGTSQSLFDAAKLPLQNVAYMTPFNSDNPRLTARIVEGLQKSIPEMGAQWEKYNQVYLGGGIAIDPYHLWTKFPIRSLADLKGRKIGAPGPAANWLKGTGAIGVAGNLTTYYNAIKTGVFEGVIVFATAAAPGKFVEVAPYITQVNFGTPFAGGLAFNKDRWQSLPDEVKAAVKAGVSAYSDEYFKELMARIDGAYAMMEKAGAKVYALPASERLKWAKLLPNVAKGWARSLDKKGLPGTKVLAGFMEALRANGVNPPRNWDKE